MQTAHAEQQNFAGRQAASGAGGILKLLRLDMSSREAGAFGAGGTP